MANEPAYKIEPVMLGPSPARDMYAARIGSSLTPARIASILSDCDIGRPAGWHDLLNELRQKDGLLHSVLQTRESALVAAGWAINAATEPGQRKPSDEDEETAAFCREAIGQVEDLDRAIDHLSDATYKGYSAVEVEWAKRGKYVLPVKLHIIQGRRLAFDDKQALRWYDDGLRTFPGDDVFAQHPARFLLHQPRVTGDAPTREGLGRPVVYSACFRNWSARDWMLFSELYGKPWRIITIDRAKAQDEDIDTANDIADNSNSSRPIVKYDAIDVKFQWPDSPGGASASPAPAIRKEFGDEIALAVLGQLGTTGDVQNGLGGKGDAREKVRGDILRLDDKRVSNTLRRLLRNIVGFNLGPVRKVPHWSFLTEDKGDAKALLDALKVGVDMGMKVPLSYVYDVTGWPRAIEGEEVLGGTPAAPLPAPLVEGEKPAAKPEPDESKQDKSEETEDLLKPTLRKGRSAFGRDRPAEGRRPCDGDSGATPDHDPAWLSTRAPRLSNGRMSIGCGPFTKSAGASLHR